MGLVSANTVVGTTATLIHESNVGTRGRPEAVLLQNIGANPIFLGGATVTTSNGVSVAANAYISLDLQQNDDLYGIVAAGTENIRKLVSVQ